MTPAVEAATFTGIVKRSCLVGHAYVKTSAIVGRCTSTWVSWRKKRTRTSFLRLRCMDNQPLLVVENGQRSTQCIMMQYYSNSLWHTGKQWLCPDTPVLLLAIDLAVGRPASSSLH